MKKGLMASFMVALMLITVLSTVVNANAITEDKVTTEDEETTGYVTFYASAWDYDFYYFYPSTRGISKVEMTLKSEDGTINRVKYTNFWGNCNFLLIPRNKNYTITAYKPGWETLGTWWFGKYESATWLLEEENSRDILFIERFLLLNLLLRKLGIYEHNLIYELISLFSSIYDKSSHSF